MSNPYIEQLENIISAFINNVYKEIPPTEEEFLEKATLLRTANATIMPVSDEEFKAKYKDGAAVIIEKLRNEISLTNENIGMHEMWNSWIGTDPYEFAAECEKNDIELIGWFELGDNAREFCGGMMLDIGIVAKYNDEDTRFWCHARKDWIVEMIEEWEEEITLQ